MKTQNIIKQLFFISLLIVGMNFYSSCDSCSRKTENTEENTETNSYESTVEEDTVTTGDETGTMNDGSTSSASIKASSGSGTKTGSKTSSAASNGNTKTPTTVENAKKEEARQQEITDMVENSDAKSAVTKNGKPVRTSGDAGTGSGTGTGSTGNNSRVTTREAQKAN